MAADIESGDQGGGSDTDNLRDWRFRLGRVWETLDHAMSDARRKRLDRKPGAVASLQIAVNAEGWIQRASGWACPRRGLGDFARFALAHYVSILAVNNRPLLKSDVRLIKPLHRTTWLPLIGEVDRERSASIKTCLRWFDTKLRDNELMTSKQTAALQKLLNDASLWNALAAAANQCIQDRQQRGARPVEGHGLRNFRFAGLTAIDDFLAYLNGGVVPQWQAPHPDDLADLGVHSPATGQFVHEVPFFKNENDDRSKRIKALAEYCAEPPDSHFRVACLYSRTEPHGLIAACNELVSQYATLCTDNRFRRLPVVYVPVGLDMEAPHVSRREVIRDLHLKLCVDRSTNQQRNSERRRLPQDATGEQIDAAIGAIRIALAHSPTLLIFGVHHVAGDEAVRVIEEEILDSPLPYAIDRLMPEAGTFGELVSPDDAYGTLALVLADAPLEKFSTFDVHCVELPRCPDDAFARLIDWNGYPRLSQEWEARSRPNIVSNEIELSIVEAALALSDSDATVGSLARPISGIFWESAPDSDRTAALLEVFVNYLNEQARLHTQCAWTLTILQIVALSAGGLRRESLARVLAGYVLATGAANEQSRPAWLASREAALWTFTHSGPLRSDDVDALTSEIIFRLEAFEGSVGSHIRVLDSINVPALDATPHLFESPEVPTFHFNFKSPKTFELRFPLVQTELCRLLKRDHRQKYALLQRLLAEQFLRRATIVQRFGTDRDQLSLVEKRYAISAIQHGLESLGFVRDSLLSEDGRRRCGWLLEPSDPMALHYWIYRRLYVRQINRDNNALSRQHGAESLKVALLKRFLRTQHEYRTDSTSLRPFQVRSEILLGLIHSGLLSCDFESAADAIDELDVLCRSMRAAVDKENFLEWGRAPHWRRQIGVVERELVKLHLDGLVLCGKEFRPGRKKWRGWKLRSLLATALEADRTHQDNAVAVETLRVDLINALGAVQESAPPFGALREAARKTRQKVSRETAQHLYDYLIRYAEIVSNRADAQSRADHRLRLRQLSVRLYEYAEELRCGTLEGDDNEALLNLSARPTNTAGRLCLRIGRALYRKGTSSHDEELINAANGYFARAVYGAYQLIGHLARYQVERVGALIFEAYTIRIRSQLSEAPDLEAAQKVLRAAETTLIQYPSRLQLWLRFYLERAKLFRDRAVQLGVPSPEALMCIRYSEADAESVKRLSGGQTLWQELAEGVLRSLPRLRRIKAKTPSSDLLSGVQKHESLKPTNLY